MCRDNIKTAQQKANTIIFAKYENSFFVEFVYDGPEMDVRLKEAQKKETVTMNSVSNRNGIKKYRKKLFK